MENLPKIYLSPALIKVMFAQIKRLDNRATRIKLFRALELLPGDEFWEAMLQEQVDLESKSIV